MSMSGAADLSWGNNGRSVGYRWEGICGKGGKVMKGRVVALQECCKREHVLRNVRKKLGAMEHERKTRTSSQSQIWLLTTTFKWPAPSDPHFCCQKYISLSQYKWRSSSLCLLKIPKIGKFLLSLILRAYEYNDKRFFGILHLDKVIQRNTTRPFTIPQLLHLN